MRPFICGASMTRPRAARRGWRGYTCVLTFTALLVVTAAVEPVPRAADVLTVLDANFQKVRRPVALLCLAGVKTMLVWLRRS